MYLITFVVIHINRWIDHFTISVGTARTACQIYNDATLTAYYPFDTSDSLLDYSVNMCNGYASGVQIISSGRVRQAISFTTPTSYFQAQCLPTTRVINAPLSFSLWVNPNVVNGGTIVHISTTPNGAGANCYDLLGLTPSGILVVQISPTTLPVVAAQGHVLPTNTWTHLAVVYSGTNGARLFVNGQISAFISVTGGALATPGITNIRYITLANTNSLGLSSTGVCPTGPLPISPGPYNGSIDEFRIYSRELSSEEICVLANP